MKKIKGKKMKTNEDTYRLLAECIRSDQLSARQVQEELEADPKFKEWYFKRFLKNFQSTR